MLLPPSVAAPTSSRDNCFLLETCENTPRAHSDGGTPQPSTPTPDGSAMAALRHVARREQQPMRTPLTTAGRHLNGSCCAEEGSGRKRKVRFCDEPQVRTYQPQAPDSPTPDLCWEWQDSSQPQLSDEWIQKLGEIERGLGLDWVPGGVSECASTAHRNGYDDGYLDGYTDARIDARLDEARRNRAINALPSFRISCDLPLYSKAGEEVDLLAYEEL